MRAGLLRSSITIDAPGTTKDTYGELLAAGATLVLTCRASISAISGKEVYALGAGFEGHISHMVTIRFPAVTIAAGMKVNYGARTLLIQFVKDPDERRRQLNLVCLEQNV